MLSVKVLVASRKKLAVLYLVYMEDSNKGGTHTMIIHLLCMIRNSLEERVWLTIEL